MIKKFLKSLGLTVLSLLLLLSLASVLVGHSNRFRSLIVYGDSGLIIRAASKIVNNGASTFTGLATFGANIISDTDGTDDVGTTTTRWDQVYADELFANKGADVASAASSFALGEDGNYYDITGTTNLDSIAAQTVGKVVALQFDGILTLTDGGNLKLHGNFITAAGATLVLQSDGTDWYELSRAGGNYIVQGAFTADALSTLTGNITATADIDVGGVLTTDGINASVIIVTDSSPYAVLLANTGMLHVIKDLGQNTVIDLPVEAAGLYYQFIYADAAVETHDHTIDSEAAANFFIGGVAFADTDAGSGADEIHLGIYSDGNSNSILTLNNLAAGSWVSFYCDGTNWYLSGDIRSDTVPTLTDQP